MTYSLSSQIMFGLCGLSGLLAGGCNPSCPGGTHLEMGYCKSNATGAVTAGDNSEGTMQSRPDSTTMIATNHPSQAAGTSEPTGQSISGLGSGGALAATASGGTGAPASGAAATGAAAIAGSGAAGGTSPEPCAPAGAMRCVEDGSGRREQCVGSSWTPTSACAQGEICAGLQSNRPGTCLSLAAVCDGKFGMMTCDGSGTLYKCDENGVLVGNPQPCGRMELCTAGITTGRCAVCVPGTHTCNGAVLMACSAAGDSNTTQETCASSSLCDEVAGRCTSASCKAGELTCMGDDLYQCATDLTDFKKVQSCGPGLCDSTKGKCNSCTPSAQRCEGQASVSCDASGDHETRTSCPKACNNGVCADCVDLQQEACGSDVGACRKGARTCVGGMFSPVCLGEVTPTPEVCDGQDNNCDGQTDECDDQALSCIQSKCLPTGGSYLDSCPASTCSVSGSTLTCTCGATGGFVSHVDIHCPSGIWQYNGYLFCGTAEEAMKMYGSPK